MRVEIADYCIRCGICIDLYPDIFVRNWETHNIDVAYDEIPEKDKDRVKQAAADCAVAAMIIKE